MRRRASSGPHRDGLVSAIPFTARFALIAVQLTVLSAFGAAADPLVLDLNGDGLDLSGQTKTSLLAGPPVTVRWTVPGTDDCFMAVDATTVRASGYVIEEAGTVLDGVVLIRDGLTVQTPDSLLHSITGAFQMLSLFDTNGSGRVDSLDTAWSDLVLWMDNDANGELVDPEVHRPPTALQVEEVGITGGPPYTDPFGNTRSDGMWGTLQRLRRHQCCFRRTQVDAVQRPDQPPRRNRTTAR